MEKRILNIVQDIFKTNDLVPRLKRLDNSYGHMCWKFSINEKDFLFKVAVRRSTPALFNNSMLAHNLASNLEEIVPKIIYLNHRTDELDFPFYIQEWIKGEDGAVVLPKLSNENKAQVFYKFGLLIGKLHQKKFPHFSQDINASIKYQSSQELSKERFEGSFVNIKKRRLINDKIMNRIESKMEEKISNIPNTISACFVHGDLHLGNLIISDNKISALLDFESSKFHDYAFDFVKLDEWVFQDYPEFRRVFFDGYSNIKRLENDFEERLLTYKAIEYLYFIEYFGIKFPENKMLVKYVDKINQWSMN